MLPSAKVGFPHLTGLEHTASLKDFLRGSSWLPRFGARMPQPAQAEIALERFAKRQRRRIGGELGCGRAFGVVNMFSALLIPD